MVLVHEAWCELQVAQASICDLEREIVQARADLTAGALPSHAIQSAMQACLFLHAGIREMIAVAAGGMGADCSQKQKANLPGVAVDSDYNLWHVFAEHRQRLAAEHEWAKKVNTAQLEALQRAAEAEAATKAHTADSHALAVSVAELDQARQRIKTLEIEAEALQESAKGTAQQLAVLEKSAQVRTACTLKSCPLLPVICCQ